MSLPVCSTTKKMQQFREIQMLLVTILVMLVTLHRGVSAAASTTPTTQMFFDHADLIVSRNHDLRTPKRQSQHRRDLLYSSSSPSSSSSSSPFSSYSKIDLPWGEINIVVVTDVHSWIGRRNSRRTTTETHRCGHSFSCKEEAEDRQIDFQDLNVDYGDVVSFWRHLQHDVNQKSRHQQDSRPRDIFFVMNGDFMDGTGLSTIPPVHLLPILKRMPWDAINVGNHELYFDETVNYLLGSGFVDHWNGTYLSSNTDSLISSTSSKKEEATTTRRPLTGHRYTYLYGPNTNTTILTFGFLYNFDGHCSTTNVTHVEEVIQQDWFINVLSPQRQHRRRHFDAILVLAHMDCTHPLVFVIHDAIRQITNSSKIPIQFITGHSHRRCYVDIDTYSSSFEAGHFLDTIGFASFNINAEDEGDHGGDQDDNNPSNLRSSSFQHRFIDATKQTLYDITRHVNDPTSFDTEEGLSLSAYIQSTRDALGLNDVIGCSKHTFQLAGPVQLNDNHSTTTIASRPSPPSSIWWLWLKDIVPDQLLFGNSSKIFIQGTMAFRYDLYDGKITLDDVIAVCPFNDTVYEMTDNISGRQLLSVLSKLNDAIYTKWANLPPVGLATVVGKDGDHDNNVDPTKLVDPDRSYALYMPDFDFHRVVNIVADEMGLIDQESLEKFRAPKVACSNTDDASNSSSKVCIPIHTTDMWKNYIARHMPCKSVEEEEQPNLDFSNGEMKMMRTTTVVDMRITDVLPDGIQWEWLLSTILMVFGMAVLIMRHQSINQSRRLEIKLNFRPVVVASARSTLNRRHGEDAAVQLPHANNHQTCYGSLSI